MASSIAERTLRHRSSAFSQGYIELRDQDLGGVCREGGDKTRESFVGARVVFGHDRLARGAKGGAAMIGHGGDQGAARDTAGDEGEKGDFESRAEAEAATSDSSGGLPSGVVWQVAAERGAHRGAQLPIKGGKQVVVEVVAVAADVIHKLGHVSALPAEDGDGVVDVRRVSHPTNSDMRSGGQRRRAELRHAASGGPKRRKCVVPSAKPWIKGPGSDEELPVVDEPFIADALGLWGVRDPSTSTSQEESLSGRPPATQDTLARKRASVPLRYSLPDPLRRSRLPHRTDHRTRTRLARDPLRAEYNHLRRASAPCSSASFMSVVDERALLDSVHYHAHCEP